MKCSESALVCLLAVSLTLVGKADDFLYVVAAFPGGPSEIHWVPVDSPISARVIVEGMPVTRSIYRYRDELWTLPQTTEIATRTDLVGQDRESIPGAHLRTDEIRLVRQGETIYWMRPDRLVSNNLFTGESKDLVRARTFFQSVAIHEDRLYVGSPNRLDSVRIDGTDHRVEAPSIRTTGLAVYSNSLFGGGGSKLWQMNIGSGEVEMLDTLLPHRLIDLAVNQEAIYWIGNDTVWRRTHGTKEDTKIYHLGDTSLESLCVVSATSFPLEINGDRHLLLLGESYRHYQILYSEDLEAWSISLLADSVFSPQGFLRWLKPKRGLGNEPLRWRPAPSSRQAYFAAWQYDAEFFDSDSDNLPDYWERRHFGDLRASGDLDADRDGLSDFGELAAMSDPNVIDSDGDGLTDHEEVTSDLSLFPTDPDSDDDTLTDGDEIQIYHTNPSAKDTDGDGFNDDFEILYQSDANSARSIPNPRAVLDTYAADLLLHYSFDFIDGDKVVNLGQIGGHGRVVGASYRLMDAQQTATFSPALEINVESTDSNEITSIFTGVHLRDLGMAAADAEFTITLWIKSDGTQESSLVTAANSLPMVTRPHRPRLNDPFLFLVRTGTLVKQLGRRSHSGLAVLSADTWHHLAWTVHAGVWRVFVDGKLVSERDEMSEQLVPGEIPLAVGAVHRDAGASTPFRGGLDDLRVYGQALPGSAIQSLSRREP